MGTCFSEELENKRHIGSTSKDLTPTKAYDQNSQLKVQVVTWTGQSIPNLKRKIRTTKKDLTFKDEGQVIYSEKSDSILHLPKEQSQKQNCSTEVNDGLDHRNTFVVDVERSQKGFQIKCLNEDIYQLITSQREISLGERFFFAGIEYKFVKFISDSKYNESKVKEVSSLKDNLTVPTQQYLQSFKHLSDQKAEQPTCRICLGEQVTNDDPLICPCDCTGSVKYFHLKCWSTWSFSCEISSEDFYLGSVTKYECELCKKNLLKDQHYRETVAALLSSAAKIKPPFIVLQGLKPDSNSLYYRKYSTKLNYIIVSFAENKKRTIGSGDVDIPSLTDEKKSKNSTVLEMRNKKIFIDDSGSKRGTYVRIEEAVTVKDDIPKYFLFKNSLISVRIA